VIGKTLGPYRVLDKLGEGGMGEVYRARDTKLHRDVALKVLPDSFATDIERLARFKREAQLLATGPSGSCDLAGRNPDRVCRQLISDEKYNPRDMWLVPGVGCGAYRVVWFVGAGRARMVQSSSMKTVGRRGLAETEIGALQRTLAAVRGTNALVPRGVYRFATFEEADAWMTRTMARTHASLKSKISPASPAR